MLCVYLWCSGLARGYETFLCSTQLGMEFQLLTKTKMLKNKDVCFSDVVIIMLINVKMPTIVGILISMSMITFMLS